MDLTGFAEMGLRGDKLRNLVESLLPGFIERGVNATETLNQLRSVGMGFRATDFYSMFRTVSGNEERSNRIRYVGENNIPSDATFDPLKYPSDSKYRVIARINAMDVNTGERVETFFGWDTNVKGTKGQMSSEGEDLFYQSDSGQNLEVMSFTVIKGFINPDF